MRSSNLKSMNENEIREAPLARTRYLQPYVHSVHACLRRPRFLGYRSLFLGYRSLFLGYRSLMPRILGPGARVGSLLGGDEPSS